MKWYNKLFGKKTTCIPQARIDAEKKELDEFLGNTRPPSEFTKGYNSFSGVDIKIYFQDEKGKKAIGTVQGFSYQKQVEDGKIKLYGSAAFIQFDKTENLLGKCVRMLAVAANEYGNISIVMDEEIFFDTQSYGIAVDDIVSEEYYTFVGTRNETIAEHTDRIDKQLDAFSEEQKREHKETIEMLSKGK